MTEFPTAARRFTLLGDPVAHSRSPAVYEAAFAALDLDCSYAVRNVTPAELADAVAEAAADGGGNVTVPHKLRVTAVIDAPSRVVSATGACNCFWRDPSGRIRGDNTDAGGFVAAAAELGPRLSGGRILVLGAGGAARAVAFACVAERVAVLEILNRTAERTGELVAGLATGGPRIEAVATPTGRYDLVVNATSLGLRPDDALPLDPGSVETDAALDLVYGVDETRWTRAMRSAGVAAADGLEMLVRQAALSLRNWIPGCDPPLEAMRLAARAGSPQA